MSDYITPLRGLLPDKAIRQLCQEHGMITPFAEGEHRPGVISYGVTSYGYDIRMANEWDIFKPGHTLDPKHLNPEAAYHVAGDSVVLPPHSVALCYSVETFDMPANVTGTCVGKSTYARVGIHPLVTPLEAGWKGVLTIEIANNTPCHVRVYGGEGIAQIQFTAGDPCEIDYAKKRGKYQNQAAEIVHSIVR